MTVSPAVQSLCEEFGVEIVGKSAYPGPRQTRAVETLARILRRHGEDHLRLVMTTLVETANNHVLLDEVGLWSASDMIRARPDIIERRAADWLEWWDRMPVGPLQAVAQKLAGIIPVRYALDGMLFERIEGRFGEAADQPDLFSDRRGAA